MNISSLKMQCFKFFLDHPERISTLTQIAPNDLIDDLLEYTTKIYRKVKPLDDALISKFQLTHLSRVDLKKWSITSAVFNQLGKDLTKLSLPPITFKDNLESQKFLDLLRNNPNLQILDLEGFHLPKDFITCLSELKNLTVLKLYKCTFEDNSTITELSLPPNLEILDLEGFHLTKDFVKCLKKLKNLTVLKLNKCTFEDNTTITELTLPSNLEILDLEGIHLPKDFVTCLNELKNLTVFKPNTCTFEENTTITELTLPPMDLNNPAFENLLKSCGKNLQSLSIEHKEDEKFIKKVINGQHVVGRIFPNDNKIGHISHLASIKEHCPNLKSLNLVNIRFREDIWFTKQGDPKTNHEEIWKKFLAPLSQLEELRLTNSKFIYTFHKDTLSFIESIHLPRCKKIVIRNFTIRSSLVERIKTMHPQLVIQDCNISD